MSWIPHWSDNGLWEASSLMADQIKYKHRNTCQKQIQVIDKKTPWKYDDPGMTIFEEYPYLSATPGMEINCNCHGAG